MFSVPVISLLISNLIPVYGVVFLGWSVANLIFLYWFENLIIGFYVVLKMLLAQNLRLDSSTPSSGKLQTRILHYFLVIFFMMHFGIFTFGHGTLLLALFGPHFTFNSGLLFAMLSLFISHGISFLIHYLIPKTYQKTSPAILLFSPYPRIVVVHLTVLFAGVFLSGYLEIIPLVLFTLLKTIVDLGSHLFEHNFKTSGKIPPFLEQFFIKSFENSVKTGKWTEIAQKMSPEDRDRVESFYRSRGINI